MNFISLLPAAAGFLWKASACSSALATRFLPPPARSTALSISLRTCWSGWLSMALKAENVRSFVTIVFMALLSMTLGAAQTAPQKQPPQSAFDAQTASRLLRQLSEALQGQSQKKFLALFDLARMKDSALFRQQIASFFSRTISIRVHLNLGETA